MEAERVTRVYLAQRALGCEVVSRDGVEVVRSAATPLIYDANFAFDVDASALKFNAFCHCKACSRARGASPAHLIGVSLDQFIITKGESNVKLAKGMGSMVQALCSECGW